MASTVSKCSTPEIESIDEIPELKLIRQKVFPDNRGYFSEIYSQKDWAEKLQFNETFVQVPF